MKMKVEIEIQTEIEMEIGTERYEGNKNLEEKIMFKRY